MENKDAAQEPIQEEPGADNPLEGLMDSEPGPQGVEEPEAETPEIPNKENPDRFEFWQSKFNQERNEREKEVGELKETLTQFQSQLEQFQQSQQPKEEPLKPPQPPRGYGTEDEDPMEVLQYLRDMDTYRAKEFEQLKSSYQQSVEERRAQEEASAQKAWAIGEFQKNGLDPNESQEAHQMFSNPDTFAPENLVQYYRFLKANSRSPARGFKEDAPPPPGVQPGRAEEPPEEDFLKGIAEFAGNRRV